MKRMNNDMAVSPIVATLVLIVVAVIGAVAVGTIMGTFSSDVSKQANANQASDASATHILVAGSTTVYPASLALASDYETQHPGIKIDVQGGGSGAGVAAAGQGIADIGASSSALTQTQLSTYPNLQTYQIGARSVVFIVNKNSGAAGQTVAKSELNTWITGKLASNLTVGGTSSNINKLVQRSDASGTESTAAKFIGASGYSGDNAFDALTTNSTPVSGNPGVIAEINGNTAGNEIGFADLGYVYDTTGNLKSTASSISVLNVTDGTNNYQYSTGSALRTACLASAKDMIAGTSQGTNWPQSLDSQLLYVTNGEPSSVVKNFITYAQSPAGGADIQSAGDFANSELV